MRHAEYHVSELENIAEWMDLKFSIPGTKLRFGLDPVVGLIPALGDTLTLAVSFYIYSQACRHDLPSHMKISMLLNIFLDWLIGLVPFVGDAFDFGWKANRRNIALLKKHLATKKAAKPAAFREFGKSA